ncbi:MAG: M23 family metallopeptidase [Patescibacteria group bacterium]
MLCFLLHLPNHRLKVTITKRKHLRGEKGLLETLKNTRSGSRISRFFRHIFEQKRIKAILGGNLALIVLAASFFSPQVSAFSTSQQTEITTLSQGAIELTTKTSIRPPLSEIKITQGFSFFHPGVDFDGITGDPVYPVMEGQVESVIYDRFALGNHIILNHGSGLKSIYAHLSKIEVRAGEKVDTNMVIGKIGSTGMAFGDHLHFEVKDFDRHLNPLSILPIK